MTYKYFLFDWDGSLANTLPILFDGYKKVFAKNGIEVSYAEIAREVMGDWDGPRRLGVVNEEKFFNDFEKEVIEKLHEAKLNPGVLEILDLIKEKGGKIAIVSSSRKRWVKVALRNNGLREMVDVFLAKEDVEYVKPNPEGLIKALRLMAGRKEEAVMIGDNERDIVAAKSAGVDCVLYFPQKYSEFYDEKRQRGLGATYVIADFSDLKRLELLGH